MDKGHADAVLNGLQAENERLREEIRRLAEEREAWLRKYEAMRKRGDVSFDTSSGAPVAALYTPLDVDISDPD